MIPAKRRPLQVSVHHESRSQTAEYSGTVAAITGPGSGTHRARALNPAAKNARHTLPDTEGLVDTAHPTRTLGAEVKPDHLDVVDRGAVLTHLDCAPAPHGVMHQVDDKAGWPPRYGDSFPGRNRGL